MTGGVSIHTMCMLYYKMNRGWGVFSSTGIGCADYRVSGELGLLRYDFGGRGHRIYLTLLGFKKLLLVSCKLVFRITF